METTFPNRLKKYRDIHGFTQKDIAWLLGFKNAHRISQWERGAAFPSVPNLLKLSIVYKALVNDFYFDFLQDLKPDILQKQNQLFITER